MQAETIRDIRTELGTLIRTDIENLEQERETQTVNSQYSQDVVEIIESEGGRRYTVQYVATGEEITGVYDGSKGAIDWHAGDLALVTSVCGNQVLWLCVPECDIPDEDDPEWYEDEIDTEQDDEEYVDPDDPPVIDPNAAPTNPGEVLEI